MPKPFTPEEVKLLWSGAMVEREHCSTVIEKWGERHGISGSAFDELLSLIRASKDPVTGEPDRAQIFEISRLKALIKEAEWCKRNCGMDVEPAGCPWCKGDVDGYGPSKLDAKKHDATCPAFTPEGEVK